MHCRKNSRIRRAAGLSLLLALLVLALPATLAAQADNQQRSLQRADALARAGKLQQARALYEKALAEGANLAADFTRSRALGMAYYSAKPPKFDEAARWLGNAWRLKPVGEPLRAALAESLRQTRQYEEALGHFAELTQAKPAVEAYAVGYAVCLDRLGRSDEGAAHLGAYLKRRPADRSARMEYANILASARRYDDAIAEYELVLKRNPKSVDAQNAIARIHSWRREYAEALQGFDSVLKQRPDDYDALSGKAFTLLWMGRKPEAAEIFAALKARRPADADIARGHDLATRQPEPEAPRVAKAPEPPKVNPVKPLMEEAAAATDRRDYTQAMHLYHQVLALDPDNYDAQMAIARILGWNKSYLEAVAQYDNVLAKRPENLDARRERARVLFWSDQFEKASSEYARLVSDLEQLEGQPGRRPSLRDVRLEYVRVLLRTRQNDIAKQQLAQLLPPDKPRTEQDVDALVVQARLQASDRQYPAALKTYDEALALDPGDSEARLGKAQTLYWSGQQDQALPVARALHQEKPDSPEAVFLLATLERNQGRTSRALHLLEGPAKSTETEDLRSRILQDMKPVLRFRYSFGNERETIFPTFGERGSTLKGVRYTSSLDFNVHPDVRMTVSQTTAHLMSGSAFITQHENDAFSLATTASIKFRWTRHLDLTLGAGHGTSGAAWAYLGAPRKHHFLYEVRPTINYGDWRFDFGSSRDVVDYTPLSVHDNVTLLRHSASATYFWRRLVRISAGYWHQDYNVDCATTCEAPDFTAIDPFSTVSNDRSFDAHQDGMQFRVMFAVVRGERVQLDVGGEYEFYMFDRSSGRYLNEQIGSAGFYMPRTRSEVGPLARLSWDVHPMVNWLLEGSGGWKRNTDFVPVGLTCDARSDCWGPTGRVATQITLHRARWEWFIRYGFSNSEGGSILSQTGLVGPNGNYRVHSASTGITYRF